MALTARTGSEVPLREEYAADQKRAVSKSPSLFRRSVVLFLVAGLVLEALLAVRLWGQLTGVKAEEGPMRLVYDYTDKLIEPFRSVEPTVSTRSEGVLEITTIEAMQWYLVAIIAGVILIIVINLACSAFWQWLKIRRYSRGLSAGSRFEDEAGR